MTLKERVLAKERLIGCYVQLTDVANSRIMGLLGYDFIWVDTEHSYMSYETLYAHILSIKSTGTPVIVRAPQHDLTATKRILEMGVDGIIFPMIRTCAEADSVIASTLYPPRGTRGFGPMGAVDYGIRDVLEYIESDRDSLCRFIQVEHKDMLDNLDAIAENEDIDGYMVGMNDLSASYGLLGQATCEKMSEVLRQTVCRLHEKGKYVALASGGYTEDILSHWTSFGIDMLVAGADFDFIRDGARRNQETMTRIFKNS